MSRKKIVIFDFDGTLTNEDSFIAFIRFTKGNCYFLQGLLQLTPFIIGHFLKLVSAHNLKEKFLCVYFEDMSDTEISDLGGRFARTKIPNLLDSKAMSILNFYREKSIPVVILSASLDVWLKPWTEHEKIQLISSKLSYKDRKAHGGLLGKNCNGQEKPRALLDQYNPTQHYFIGYGNSRDDLPFLKICQEAYIKKRGKFVRIG